MAASGRTKNQHGRGVRRPEERTALYKQTVARKQPHTALAFVIIFVGVFVIYFLASFIVYAGARLGVPYLEYAVYALLIAAGYFILRDWLTSYRYALSETELLLEKYTGKRMSQREVIELRAIESFGPYKKGAGDPKPEGGTLLFGYKKRVDMALTVRADGTRYLILLQPDAELSRRLCAVVQKM